MESTNFPWCLQVSLFKKIYKYPISNRDKIDLAVWNLLWNHQTFGEIPKLSGSNWNLLMNVGFSALGMTKITQLQQCQYFRLLLKFGIMEIAIMEDKFFGCLLQVF